MSCGCLSGSVRDLQTCCCLIFHEEFGDRRIVLPLPGIVSLKHFICCNHQGKGQVGCTNAVCNLRNKHICTMHLITYIAAWCSSLSIYIINPGPLPNQSFWEALAKLHDSFAATPQAVRKVSQKKQSQKGDRFTCFSRYIQHIYRHMHIYTVYLSQYILRYV